MKITLNKEDLKDFIKDEYFIEAVAKELVKTKKNLADEFDGQLITAFEKADKEIIDEYIREYYSADPKNRIIKALGEMDKKQIIELIQ